MLAFESSLVVGMPSRPESLAASSMSAMVAFMDGGYHKKRLVTCCRQ